MKEFHSKKYYLEEAWRAILKDLNIPVQEVLRQARLPLDLLYRKRPVVTAEEYFRFWEGLACVTRNEPAFALRLIQNINAKTTDPTIIAFLSSSDLNMALQRAAHYKAMVAPVHLAVMQNEWQTVLSIAASAENTTLPPLFIAFELVFWVQLARIATREQLKPNTVDVSMYLPESEAYKAFLGTSIRRDKNIRITFSAVDAQRPFLTANHAMWAILEPAFDKRMEDLTRDASLRDRVRACLLEMLASGHYSINHIASKLAMSSRTLQRRLQEEGTTFQTVLDELREELARHYLARTDFTSLEISFLLGYEEPNSFFRAFRAWTGQTPEIVRAQRL